MNSEKHFKTIVIGAGPGGEDCARLLSSSGHSTALVNDAPLPGGECLWRGCIPSKIWRATADRIRDSRRNAEFALVSAEAPALDWKALQDFRRRLQEERGALALKTDASAKINYIEGRARFTAPGTLEVSGESYSFDTAVIAVGAPPFLPPVEGLKEALEKSRASTSDSVWDLEAVPQRLAVLGAGAIGIEMAQIFADFGSRVRVYEILDRILPEMEKEISSKLEEALREEAGLEIRTSCPLQKIEVREDHLILHSDSDTQEVDHLILATGKRPDFAKLGLESLGLDSVGTFLTTDKSCRTSVEGIYAVGDVSGGRMLAHSASREGRVAARNILGEHCEYDPDLDGGVIFSRPQVASFGLSLAEAKERGIAAGEMKLPLSVDAMAAIHREKHGLIKMLASEEDGRILGVHLLAEHADTLVGEAVALVTAGVTVYQLSEAVHPHPTQTELFGEMAQRLAQRFRRRRKGDS
ncbi:MAG: NAD(P)/FAD-dependent oxidoreductase [Candidatus Krumholzibacteria bacterium]|jgi:dihydrolipoamide dehydrogenase|nr:NAD(P)/FAD-dependent oxidoreductase [Candidatus Krumholzibacteria bacterium]MDP6669145.1 NAD(P)/FAD-dependent oxidoreductase [Candidatus Krumholzibacteria bacterium]MDP6797546.1 NAD(P)/FAD-dependent oxidoreductase [Candidatus Krumholzibacteria bacterium]MDP7021309.1 NAD(P)/FAD-dependent oxidoreductase [Candidatus Krumholzibacteria bacterium]